MKFAVVRLFLICVAAASLCAIPMRSCAQGVTVQSIQSPALGNVTSAASGTTIFRLAADSGTVTKLSGSGARFGGGSTHPLVTLACGSDANCATQKVTVTVSNLSQTGRVGPTGNFTVSAVSAVIDGAPTGTDQLSFTIEPIGQNATRSFYLGMDVPILGNDSAQPTGVASATFEVSAALAGADGPDGKIGTLTATVIRPIAVSEATALSFGTLIRSATGSGTVALDPANGNRTLDGVTATGPAPAPARFVVNGEGGQSFYACIPEMLDMTGPGGTLTVKLVSDAGTAQNLDGSLGSPGTAQFHVGGSFVIPAGLLSGVYSGNFAVTVQYN